MHLSLERIVEQRKSYLHPTGTGSLQTLEIMQLLRLSGSMDEPGDETKPGGWS